MFAKAVMGSGSDYKEDTRELLGGDRNILTWSVEEIAGVHIFVKTCHKTV